MHNSIYMHDLLFADLQTRCVSPALSNRITLAWGSRFFWCGVRAPSYAPWSKQC